MSNTAASVEQDQQRILEMVMDAGRTLLENGAEVFRVEQTMQIMAGSLGLQEFEVYVLTNGIFASVGGNAFAQVRHIPSQEVHLDRVAAVNDLSRRIAAGKADVQVAEEELKRIKVLPGPSSRVQFLSCAVGAACFTLMFGGSMQDGVASFLTGLLLHSFLTLASRHRLNKIMTKMAGAAVIAAAALLMVQLFPVLQMDKIIIGALMNLTPGVALTTSIRDFVNGDYLSGTIRMIDALLIAGALACGVGLVLGLAQMGLGVKL